VNRTAEERPHDWPSAIDLRPFDAANAELLTRVAPRDWVNPTPQPRYHLVVIGAGTAGLVSAAIAAGLGARVALVERHMFGGDCLNFGCVPSKAVIRAARAWHDAVQAQRDFGGPSVGVSGDFPAVMARMRALRAAMSDVDGAERFRSLGVDVFFGDAAFTGRNTVQVGSSTLRFRRAIIATGARASVPPIPGLADAPYLTNETVFSLTERPARLAVLGGGPIGAELAQSFARFGSAVTVLHADARLLPRETADAATAVMRAFDTDGVTVHNGASISRVDYRENEFVISAIQGDQQLEVRADQLLVATGRRPNVESMGLDAAGVAFTNTGITVNDRLRTSNPNIYAIGDVSSALQFTHVADAQARLVVANALFFGIGGGRASSLVVPRVTYTSPEVAHVGLTVADAESRSIAIETVRVDMTHNDRARLDGSTDGFLAVHLKRGTDTILGGTLVADHAGEMIGELAVAIRNGIGLSALGSTIHAYPTQAEVYRRAADTWRRQRLTPFARRVFSTWFKVFS